MCKNNIACNCTGERRTSRKLHKCYVKGCCLNVSKVELDEGEFRYLEQKLYVFVVLPVFESGTILLHPSTLKLKKMLHGFPLHAEEKWC